MGIWAQSHKFRIASWNLENMFDTVHEERKVDYEFLPMAERRWNSKRYWKKLKGITQTLAAMDLPAVVALQEIENDTVLRDLTRRTALRSVNYRYIVTDSPDERGVDVALLYRENEYQVYNYRAVRVPSHQYGLRPTRDILVCSGFVLNKGARCPFTSDTLHVIVVHLPSRRNNNASTKRLRTLALETLLDVIDSLGHEKTILLGDFNAEPDDSLFGRLCPPLLTAMPTKKSELRCVRGSYYFRGEWGYLDHMLISADLQQKLACRAEEYRFQWLMTKNGHIPRRTYGGTNYIGGISDHLPIAACFEF